MFFSLQFFLMEKGIIFSNFETVLKGWGGWYKVHWTIGWVLRILKDGCNIWVIISYWTPYQKLKQKQLKNFWHGKYILFYLQKTNSLLACHPSSVVWIFSLFATRIMKLMYKLCKWWGASFAITPTFLFLKSQKKIHSTTRSWKGLVQYSLSHGNIFMKKHMWVHSQSNELMCTLSKKLGDRLFWNILGIY